MCIILHVCTVSTNVLIYTCVPQTCVPKTILRVLSTIKYRLVFCTRAFTSLFSIHASLIVIDVILNVRFYSFFTRVCFQDKSGGM